MTEPETDGATGAAWTEFPYEFADRDARDGPALGDASPAPAFGEPLSDGVLHRDDGMRRPRRAPGPPADGMAIAALVLSLVGLHLLGVILGHVALSRIRRTAAGGRGLAIAALVLGYAGLALALTWWTIYFAWLAPVVTLPG